MNGKGSKLNQRISILSSVMSAATSFSCIISILSSSKKLLMAKQTSGIVRIVQLSS